MFGLFDNPAELVMRLPIVLLALTVHEFCHAYFALRMGDRTAYYLGRCTLNPLKHLDPLGTICLIFAPIGWAKPVPINPLNFHDRRKGILVSTAAGPASNLVQAILFALLLRGVRLYDPHASFAGIEGADLTDLAFEMCIIAIFINVGLAVFNCLPFYPLDGFHITMQFQSLENQRKFEQTAHYGPMIIIGLIIAGNFGGVDILHYLMNPPVTMILEHVAGLRLRG